jgi:hypothetical protein
MSKYWPWSNGVPVAEGHNELEEKMGPDPERESDIYELQRQPRGGDSSKPPSRRPKNRGSV